MDSGHERWFMCTWHIGIVFIDTVWHILKGVIVRTQSHSVVKSMFLLYSPDMLSNCCQMWFLHIFVLVYLLSTILIILKTTIKYCRTKGWWYVKYNTDFRLVLVLEVLFPFIFSSGITNNSSIRSSQQGIKPTKINHNITNFDLKLKSILKSEKISTGILYWLNDNTMKHYEWWNQKIMVQYKTINL